MTVSASDRNRASSLDGVVLFLLGGALSLLVILATAVELGALLEHGTVVPLGTGGVDALVWPLRHATDPEDGWPAAIRSVVPGRGLYWFLVAAEAALAAAAVAAVASAWSRRPQLRGFARAGSLGELGAAAQRVRARSLRPALDRSSRRRASAGSVGVYLGRHGLRPLYGSLEDVYLLVGAIRRGKTGLLTEMVADWAGPILFTTSKPGDLEALLPLLSNNGRRVHLFDPLHLSPWPARLRWDPVFGCAEPLIAAARANAFMAPVRKSADDDGVDWGLLAELLLTCLLHAAAVDGVGLENVVSWSQAPTVHHVLEILGRSRLAPQWRQIVELQSGSAPETWASIQVNLQTALAAVRQPAVMRWVGRSRPARAPRLDPRVAVLRGDAIVVLGTDAAQSNMAPLTTALCDAVIEAALTAARRAPRGRLDPPLLLALDEVTKIAPLPALPRLASEGSSQGIVPVLVAQDPAQLRAAFGDAGAEALWTCATAKVVFGGITGLRDREQISALSREIEIEERAPARLLVNTREPISRRVRALTVDAVYRIPRERAVLFYGGLDPVHVSVRGPHHLTSRLHRRWVRAHREYARVVGLSRTQRRKKAP